MAASVLFVAVPVCHKDFDIVMRNLDLCLELDGGKVPHHALVLWDNVLENAKGMEVVAKASQYFSNVAICNYTDLGVKQWPQPQNNAWQNAARWMERGRNKDGAFSGWLWWESDALPLKKGWLDALNAGYKKSRKPFYGHIVEGMGHMNGVAVYPFNISDYCYNAMLTRQAPFDIVLHNEVSFEKFDRANDLILHQVKQYGGELPIQVDSKDEINSSTAVLWHGVTLREQDANVNPETVQYLPWIRQTRWECGTFNLPGNTALFHFNCSLVDWNDKLLLFTRRALHKTPNHSDRRIFQSDVGIFEVNESDISHPKMVGFPKPVKSVRDEQWEDPRVIVFDGKLHISLANWIHNQPMNIKQILTVLSDDMKTFQTIAEPKYQGTEQYPEQMSNSEKNWLWFNHNGVLHCVYFSNPLVVFTWNKKRIETVYRSNRVEFPWKFGNPRGGTPPVKVGDEYITFFHSHLKWGERRRYHMGAMAFTDKAPFKITRITVKPLLSGSEHDHRAFGGPPCIFPCGAVKRDGYWLVSFGVNDENSGWIKIPDKDLNERMRQC